MEEAPLQFIDAWNYWAKIAAGVFIGVAVLRIIFYYIKLVTTKDYKVRYDYINENEISMLWSATIMVLI